LVVGNDGGKNWKFEIMSTDHSVHLAESLQQLQLEQQGKVSPHALLPSLAPREGYGFRHSGATTPLIGTGTATASEDTSLPDPHGLGWPGENLH
jgi:hypothetical protein